MMIFRIMKDIDGQMRFQLEKPNLKKKNNVQGKGLVGYSDKWMQKKVNIFITLTSNELDQLQGHYILFGRVVEGCEKIVSILNGILTMDDQGPSAVGRPYENIFICHTIVLYDPFDLEKKKKGFTQLIADLSSPFLSDNDNDNDGDYTKQKVAEEEEEEEEDNIVKAKGINNLQQHQREVETKALMLEIAGDLPEANVKPPESTLFVCKLNRLTRDEDLEIIFSKYGEIESCQIARDRRTGQSLGYAFVDFKDRSACEEAYVKMENVLIDKRRIHVDFSQSVQKLWQHHRYNHHRHHHHRHDHHDHDNNRQKNRK